MTKAIVMLVDGLGVDALRARSGHARHLVRALDRGSTIETGFPTTTASALATLMTGCSPGEHGIVGYSALDPAHGRLVKQISGWDEQMEPTRWQRRPTLFESWNRQGIESVAVGPARYRDSGFTRAVLRGSSYQSAETIEDRMVSARDVVASAGSPMVVYVYVPELDMAAHRYGWQSQPWTDALERTDAAIGRLISELRPTDGLLVTADHGILDIPEHARILVDENLLSGIRFVAGEPRCLQLHFAADTSWEHRRALVEEWRDVEGSRAWVATRDEAIDAGWFGIVDPMVAPRIGDVLIAARRAVAYYPHPRGEGDPDGWSMIGQHGSWSPSEVRVPLLRYGAFA